MFAVYLNIGNVVFEDSGDVDLSNRVNSVFTLLRCSSVWASKLQLRSCLQPRGLLLRCYGGFMS